MRALFITTSAAQLAPDHPTGLWLEEFAVPYLAVTEAGITVTVASPQGGPVPLDPKTAPTDKQRETWARPLQALRHSVTLASVRDETFDAVFIPGGHGPATIYLQCATVDGGQPQGVSLSNAVKLQLLP